MDGPAPNLWLVAHLAARSLEHGTLRTYWPQFERYASRPTLATRAVARMVWLGLLPVMPLLASRRRRLVAHALEAVVRTVVAGVEVSVAVDRGVAWLTRKGLDPEQARTDLERLLGGFLSDPAAARGAERHPPAARRTQAP